MTFENFKETDDGIKIDQETLPAVRGEWDIVADVVFIFHLSSSPADFQSGEDGWFTKWNSILAHSQSCVLIYAGEATQPTILDARMGRDPSFIVAKTMSAANSIWPGSIIFLKSVFSILSLWNSLTVGPARYVTEWSGLVTCNILMRCSTMLIRPMQQSYMK